MPKLRNSIKWRISNPGCLDCEIVSQKERAKHLTDQRHSLHHHQPVNSRLNSRNTFISTSHPLLCKPAEARASKWQEQWEQTDSNQKRYNIHPKERLPRGHTLPWRAWRTANRVHVSETYVGLPGEQNMYVRRSHMRPESYHDKLHKFRRETERRRHCGTEGWICAVADCRCRLDITRCNAVR